MEKFYILNLYMYPLYLRMGDEDFLHIQNYEFDTQIKKGSVMELIFHITI